MESPNFDSTKALAHLQEMRRKVVAAKGGHSVEGLTELSTQRETKPIVAPKGKSQELDV